MFQCFYNINNCTFITPLSKICQKCSTLSFQYQAYYILQIYQIFASTIYIPLLCTTHWERDKRISRQIYATYLENRTWQLWSKLGNNCIVFENFTASVGDVMVANWVNGYLRPWNRQLMPWNFQIQYSYLHSNVIMCIDVHCHIIDKIT